MSHIIGIRYIGKKPRKEDTVGNTGAVWKPGQVHNFAEPIARELLAHTDSFEVAPVSIDGDTFMGAQRAKTQAPVVTYVNLTNMDADQLALFARREFNRVVDIEGRDVEAVRADVHRLMMTMNMDDIAAEAATADLKDRIPYTLNVSVAEYEALMAGHIVSKLVPAEVSDEIPEVVETATAPMPPDVSDAPAPTLPELLDSLTTKDELLAFAVQEGVDGLNGRHSVETMRARILEVLTQKAA